MAPTLKTTQFVLFIQIKARKAEAPKRNKIIKYFTTFEWKWENPGLKTSSCRNTQSFHWSSHKHIDVFTWFQIDFLYKRQRSSFTSSCRCKNSVRDGSRTETTFYLLLQDQQLMQSFQKFCSNNNHVGKCLQQRFIWSVHRFVWSLRNFNGSEHLKTYYLTSYVWKQVFF